MVELQVGVKILLKSNSDVYLLLLRSKEFYVDSGNIWDLPGGRIDAGISLLENLKREVREETSFDINGTPKLIAAQDIMPTGNKHIVRLTYVIDVGIDSKPTLSEEHSDYGWFSIDKMKDLDKLDKYLKELIESGTLF